MKMPWTVRLMGVLALSLVSSSAFAALVTYGFFGSVNQQTIAGFPAVFSEPVGGFFQYNTAAPTVPGGPLGSYSDPAGFLFIGFNDVAIIGYGLEIQVTRTNIPPFISFNALNFRSENLLVDGAAPPLDFLSLTFFSSDPLVFQNHDIPELIDPAMNAQLFIASPDLAPTSGLEPPRTGFLTASNLDFWRDSAVPVPGSIGLLCLGIALLRLRLRVGTNTPVVHGPSSRRKQILTATKKPIESATLRAPS